MHLFHILKNDSDKLTPSDSKYAETGAMFTSLPTAMSQITVLSSHLRKTTTIVTPISSTINVKVTGGN